ncbi:hypothetical protein M406DRAFT_354670 [Cryphonectria parasitica EP155]|uniref:Uncharacterized protein n=1 Tax=Cryphonectria parasitica (strain ATCC 38755 / EP155) TaxID=660469 RepID=A0A9P4YDE7_CRYP1|nr:uncharacterized protein M406DRAFT_354670 [Cryphonectria parasitica EP155]KAF3771023.1 hypothetical protein M406DRAFT_354670 [Cryphonectria parasitica EP155]
MSLCSQCKIISTVPVSSDEEGHAVYIHNSATFKKAVGDGCYFCTKVQKEMPEDVQKLLDRPGFPGICCRICENQQRYGIDFSIPGKQQLAFFWLQEYTGEVVMERQREDLKAPYVRRRLDTTSF